MSNHSIQNCRKQRTCSVPGCNERHAKCILINHQSSYLVGNRVGNYESGENIRMINASLDGHGLGVLAATTLMVGELAGSGLLALPKAVVNSGWVGIPLIALYGVLAGYGGIVLGRCWDMAQERWPKYRSATRDPYPALGEEAYGKPMRYVVRLTLYLLHFGACTVFLLLSSQNIQSILKNWGITQLSFCHWLLIITALLIPCTWLGTPKDFWPIATGAGVATAIACLLIIVAIGTDPRNIKPVHSNISFQSFFLSFGTISFAVGGVSIVPTVQHDMKEPRKFYIVGITSFSLMVLMYVPVAAAGYFVYGDAVSTNILQSLPPGGLRLTTELLITAHLVLAFNIIFNPVTQDIEGFLNIPLSFNWRRALIRTTLLGMLLFVALSIPKFGAILDFVGGSAVCFLTFVAPPLLYLKFKSMKGDWKETTLSLQVKVLNVMVIIVGIVGGIASSWSALSQLASVATFLPPCYVNMTAAEGH